MKNSTIRDSEYLLSSIGTICDQVRTDHASNSALHSSLLSNSFSGNKSTIVNTSGNKVKRCINCSRTFSTKIGLSQHRRHRHPDEYALHLQLGRNSSRNHIWIDEEICLLAKMEINLINESSSNARNINQLLSNRLPGRTANEIACLRRPRYKEIYKRVLQESVSSDSYSSIVHVFYTTQFYTNSSGCTSANPNYRVPYG